MPGIWDVIVVGSGFGGAVTACRLAEAGARVLMLERGRRWSPDTYPRKPEDPWLFDHGRPDKHHGWLDLRFFKGMAVAQGAGVGGGSLCYSSVVMEADPHYFDQGWPPEITFPEVRPYYEKVKQMLAVQPIPPGQHTQRYKLAERAAEKLGYQNRFQSVPLALSFDPEWNYELPEPLSVQRSKPFLNSQGQKQGTCVHLGNCDIGCDVRAKNTLDVNYIPAAEQRGADVRPLHIVRYLEPVAGGYRVVFDRIVAGRLIRGEERAMKVVLAAGSLGSTELLLRCRDQYGTLPQIGPLLGRRWSANANVLTPDFYRRAEEVHQGIGPTISSGINFMDGSMDGQRFFIEDDGFPNLLLNAVNAKLRSSWFSLFAWLLRGHLRRGLDEQNPLGNLMVWLGEGIDGGNGRLVLRRSWLMPWKKDLKLRWDMSESEKVIEAILNMHGRLSQAAGGQLKVPFYWTLLKCLITVHPLGGCKVGKSSAEGVVDHRGQVFGHANLYVSDGAILPGPVGRNPSMTIAALAERTAWLMTQG